MGLSSIIIRGLVFFPGIGWGRSDSASSGSSGGTRVGNCSCCRIIPSGTGGISTFHLFKWNHTNVPFSLAILILGCLNSRISLGPSYKLSRQSSLEMFHHDSLSRDDKIGNYVPFSILTHNTLLVGVVLALGSFSSAPWSKRDLSLRQYINSFWLNHVCSYSWVNNVRKLLHAKCSASETSWYPVLLKGSPFS